MNSDETSETPIDVPQILDSAQRSAACHLKHARNLKKVIEKGHNGEHLEKLYNCLASAFLTSYRNKNIYLERVISFIALFTCSFKPVNNDESMNLHPTLLSIFEFILELSQSAQDSQRYWSCILLNKIFEDLEELTTELYDKIKESMLEKLKDPKSAIRFQAVISLHRLQDPGDLEDRIISDFCDILISDPNAKVRAICVEKLALNRQVAPFVLGRLRDVDNNVRLIAFKKISPVPKYLKITQRHRILHCGFNDTCEKIKQYFSTVLLATWLEKYDNDFLNLIKAIRLDACEQDIVTTTDLVEKVLSTLFKSTSIEKIIEFVKVNEQKMIAYEDLSWESVLYYRISVQYLNKSPGFEDTLNKILPELVPFCQYIKKYCEFIKNNNCDEAQYYFTLEQFFLITKGYDVGDSASRQCLNSLAFYMLQNEILSPHVAHIIVQNLENTIPNVKNRSMFVCEIISNIMYGENAVDYEETERKNKEKNLAISQLQSDISSLQDQEKHLVFVERNFVEAERVKNQIDEKSSLLDNLKHTVREKPVEIEKKSDLATISKCLTLAEALLLSATVTEFNPAIATLATETINPALMHDDNGVKAKALKCYALCCVIDERSARYGIHLFSGLIFAGDLENIDILVISIKAAVDILSMYGLSLVEKREEEEENGSDSRSEEVKKVFVGGTSLTDLMQALADHLQHEDPRVQEIATHGICILLLDSRITSPSLLSRIIIKWANPATDDEKLKQFIGLSLNSLTALPNCHTYFGDAVISTIKTLVYAPKNSPLNDIDLDNLIKFMVSLCHIPSQGAQIHADLALKFCTQMRENPKAKTNLYFSKALVLTVPEKKSFDGLLQICDELRDVIGDNQTLRNINKFITFLNKDKVNLTPITEEDAI